MKLRAMLNTLWLVISFLSACASETIIEEEQEDDPVVSQVVDETPVDDVVIGKGIARNYLYDENIQSDSAVIFSSGFENGFEGWSKYNAEISEIITDSKLAFSGSKVLKSTAKKGINEGGDVDYDISPEQDRIFLRFYTKIDKYSVLPHHFVKIRAIRSGYWPNAGQKPPGDRAFWTGIEPSSNRTWHFYTYWHDMHSWQSKEGIPDGRANPYYGNLFDVPDQAVFTQGEWICIEAMVKANTPNKYDGEQAFWINGVKVGHWKKGEPKGEWGNDKFIIGGDIRLPFEGFNWRTSKDVNINMIKLQWYVSNRVLENATQVDNIVYFDNVVVATQYIGPMCDENGMVLKK